MKKKHFLYTLLGMIPLAVLEQISYRIFWDEMYFDRTDILIPLVYMWFFVTSFSLSKIPVSGIVTAMVWFFWYICISIFWNKIWMETMILATFIAYIGGVGSYFFLAFFPRRKFPEQFQVFLWEYKNIRKRFDTKVFVVYMCMVAFLVCVTLREKRFWIRFFDTEFGFVGLVVTVFFGIFGVSILSRYWWSFFGGVLWLLWCAIIVIYKIPWLFDILNWIVSHYSYDGGFFLMPLVFLLWMSIWIYATMLLERWKKQKPQ